MFDHDESFRRYASILGSYLLVSGPESIDPSASLMDLGLDSLNTVEILVELEEEFGVQLPDEELNENTFSTVGSLWAVLSGRAERPGHLRGF